MALTVADPGIAVQQGDDAEALPNVMTTPCGDTWPRPYYLEKGLRRVQPYFFTYNTHAKGRWRDREILDIFESEFRDRPAEYYKNALETGNIVINGEPVFSTSTIVKNGDVISHTLHRHEPPVSAGEIGVVYEDEGIIVINKPAGVPVHPAGRYNFNSVIEIMKAERAYAFKPLPCHRLDRLTSGIMFIGKHPKAADAMSKQIKQRTVKKEYVARVAGEFPEVEIICEKPVLQISPKLGLNGVRANGKEARTVFKRLAYYPPKNRSAIISQADSPDSSDGTAQGKDDGMAWKRLPGYSIVRCRPLTGRTHQIRVHLQFLGHPIQNDPIYCNQRVFGPNLGHGEEGADNDESIMTRLSRMGKAEIAETIAYYDEIVESYEKRRAEKQTGETCKICDTELYSDPGPHELGIYLHARRYECETGKWGYETPLPAWALPPTDMEGPTECTPETDPLSIDLEKLGLNADGTKPTDAEEEPLVGIATSSS